MNGSNSFNICPRCGNSNALNAKYCSRCGAQLKVPEEPVVCHKCHTRNTPMANFCRNCGTTLKIGAETKLCPKCGKELGVEENVCVCGYSFVTMQQTVPSDTPVEESDANEVGKDTKSEKLYDTKGGRGWAIAATVLITLFAYYIIAPWAILIGENVIHLRPEFLVALEKGFVYSEGSVLYGYDYVVLLINVITSVAGGEMSFGDALGSLGVGNIMILIFTLMFIITAIAHLIVSIVRSCTTKRSKHMNWYFLIAASLSTLVIGLITLFSYVKPNGEFMAKVASWFSLEFSLGLEEPVELSIGFAIWAIPLYFWFFFLYSLGAKAKELKEQAA